MSEWKLALAAFAIGIAPSARAGLNSGPEYDALLALYASTNGQNWSHNFNWGTGDACSWNGLFCDQDTTPNDNSSHVIRVFMHSNNMTGSLPPLGALSHLQFFEVENNNLTGSIPDLSGLPELSDFGVSVNQLSGPLPSLAGTAMQYFYAGYNHLTGSIPAIAGMDLYNFDVSHNDLTGVLPELTGLPHLRSFGASSNRLTGSIPSLGEVGSPFYLQVSNNQLSGAVPPAPVGLASATLCPNPLDLTPQPDVDPAWDTATGSSPWWATPSSTALCDDLLNAGFDTAIPPY